MLKSSFLKWHNSNHHWKKQLIDAQEALNIERDVIV